MRGYKLALHYTYLGTGFGLLNYFKYVIMFFGFASSDVKSTLFLAAGWAIASYITGMIAFKTGFVEAQAEVANQYNLFVKQMRENRLTENLK